MRAVTVSAIAMVAALASVSAGAAVYTDRAAFEATLTTSFTDTYEPPLGYPVGFSSAQSDATMSAVVGQTKYMATGFANNNLTFTYTMGQAYCAGCNGSFTLDFTGTSYGTSAGVFGVGLDILRNLGNPVYTAFVTYGDGSTANFGLPQIDPVGLEFFGITSPSAIRSIAFGLPNGGTTQDGSFIIDNLTIGSGTLAPAMVPEPATWAMMVGGFGMIGARMRRRARARIAYS